MKRVTETYTLALRMYVYATSRAKEQIVFSETASRSSYDRIESALTYKLFQDVTISAQGFKCLLSTGALKLVAKIEDELYMNNALWYYKPENSKQYSIIRELLSKRILFKTDDPYIFFVNPMAIRRGTTPAVLAHMADILCRTSKVTLDHIHDIRYTDKINIDQFTVMNNDIDLNNTPLLPEGVKL